VLRLWVPLPQGGNVASPPNIRLYAHAAEELRFDGVWLGDHITMPRDYQSRYPYGEQHAVNSDRPFYEAYTTLAYVAGITRRIRLAVTVAVAGYRHPLLHAKVIATLDSLSEGRLEVGLGAGWLAEEFEALGMAFSRRQTYFLECVDAMTRLWQGDVVDHDGEAWQFRGANCHPTPVQVPHPPLWVGGSAKLLRRFPDKTLGWVAPDVPPGELFDDIARLRADDRAGQPRAPIAVKLALTDGPPSRESPLCFDVSSPAAGYELLRGLHARGVTDVRLNLVDLAPRKRLGVLSVFSRQLAEAGLRPDH
jgi:probable F420-dependent oxidoreductase